LVLLQPLGGRAISYNGVIRKEKKMVCNKFEEGYGCADFRYANVQMINRTRVSDVQISNVEMGRYVWLF